MWSFPSLELNYYSMYACKICSTKKLLDLCCSWSAHVNYRVSWTSCVSVGISLFVFGMTLVCRYCRVWISISMCKCSCVFWCVCVACSNVCEIGFIFVHSGTNALNNPKDYIPHESSLSSFSLYPLCWLSNNSVVK